MHTRHPIEPPKDSSTTPYDSANQGRYDGRKQGTEEIHELRKHVVALHLEGLSHRQICEATQLSSTVIRKILALFAKGGMDLLAPKVRGRRFGSCRALTVEQEMRILSLICLGSPRKVGLDFDLWEKNAVIQLVQQQLRRTLSVNTAKHYLSRWGFAFRPALGVMAWDDPSLAALLKFVRPKQQTRVVFQQLHWSLNATAVDYSTDTEDLKQSHAELFMCRTVVLVLDRKQCCRWWIDASPRSQSSKDVNKLAA